MNAALRYPQCRERRYEARTMSCESIKIPLRDADIVVYPQLFSPARADALLQHLLAQTEWRQDHIRIYGKLRKLPRLTAWYGDPGCRYEYSGITLAPLPWIRCLSTLRARLETLTGDCFNSVLLNYYRDGSDRMGWHSDDEQTLGLNPVIGSLSLGATRRFRLQHKTDKALKKSIELCGGSYLLMAGATQHHWRHCITRTQRVCGPRINLTFRKII